MSGKRILIIDDEKNMQHMLRIMLDKAGYEAETASDGLEALDLMREKDFDVILCDLKMPRMDGMTFLGQSIQKYPEKTYIMMSAYGTIETALEAMKTGAYDYISKPFKQDEVLLTLKKAEERERLKRENLELHKKINRIEKSNHFSNMVAKSENMAQVFDLVTKVADYKTIVLITGESGTGKELVAKAIHSNGVRASESMVSINCGGIPENLLESELFGFKKGAFTDAARDKPGLFKKADKGTIFLDEIGDLPLSLQVKLLRVLQEGEITPLGATESEKIDVRVITATGKNLEKEVEEGRFREDLFYRINVLTIHLPPLRERPEDIPLLSDHFIRLFNEKLNKEVNSISPEAMSVLMNYQWPGNVRELENVMERAVLLCQNRVLTIADFPSSLRTGESGLFYDRDKVLSIKKASRRLERDLIQKALKATKGNRSKAARLLEISRPILISKIKSYKID